MSSIHHCDTVAVIVVNYNSGDLLEKCLAALNRQTRRADRIVVVDNASTDDSLARVIDRYEDVEWLRQTENLGFASANNLAAARVAEADWLALVNPDAEPRPEWLEKLLDAARRQPDGAGFASLTLVTDRPDRVDGMGDDYHASGLVWRRGHGRLRAECEPVDTEVFSACAAAALYRRAAWDAAGGFDDSYFCFQEDVDLGFRMRLLGYRNFLVADAQALHHGSAIAGRDSQFALYHGHRNLVWTFFKNMPGPLLVILAPFHLAALVYLVLRHVPRGHGRTLVTAFGDGLRGLPRQWARRCAIQRRRNVSLGSLAGAFRWLPVRR